MKSFLLVIFFLLIPLDCARAESQAACSIWLCLPGGFPSGCAAALDEFKTRIRKGRPPLPDLASCMVSSPLGKGSNGSYQMGVELFMPCKSGFMLYVRHDAGLSKGICYSTSPSCHSSNQMSAQNKNCAPYMATKRIQKNYIKIWIDGEYIGQFFY